VFTSFFWSARLDKLKWKYWKHVVRAYSGAAILLAILLVQVKIALMFNDWNARFFDTMAHATERSQGELWTSLIGLGTIVSIEIAVNPLCGFVRRMYTLWWREAFTEYFIPKWRMSGRSIEGASQRIQQDPMEFAAIIEDIGLELVRSVLILIAFIPLLCVLSANIQTGPVAWYGSFAVIAIVCSLGGMYISWIVGARLTQLQYDNEKTEAAFRKHLVLAEDQREHLDQDPGWRAHFRYIVENNRHLFLHFGYFDGWSTMYAKFMILLPLALCIPHMANGAITLAVLLKLLHAFAEVQGGFSFILRSWPRVTKLRCVYKRLRELETMLAKPSEPIAAIPVYADPKIIQLHARMQGQRSAMLNLTPIEK
jgi:peptide/bleomycin uptake transporter